MKKGQSSINNLKAATNQYLFCRLFEAYPDMKQAFPAFRDVEFSELKKSHELRHHSSRYATEV